MIKGWKDLFRTHILERGLNYYESGAVVSLDQTESGYNAIVEGTEDYQVEIEIQNDRVRDMFCDCPYAEDGNYCKHMAAVLYELEEEKTESDHAIEWQVKIQESRQELAAVVDRIPEKEVKRLLIELAVENDSLRNRILTAYSEDISEHQMLRLKKEVDEFVYQYSDRHGYVDYYHASYYIDALNGFMYEKVQTLIDKHCYIQAFDLINHVFYSIGNQNIDDTDGGMVWVANTCYEFWQQILEKCEEKDRQQMFQWFLQHQEDYVIDYFQEYIEDFLMNEFYDSNLLEQKLKMLDESIARAEGKTDCGKGYSAHYGYEDNILKRIQIMKKLGASEQEISEYRKQYRHFSTIRCLEVQEYLEKKKFEDAIKVLLESKELDKDYAGLVSQYSSQLIDIYRETGQEADYRKELEYRIFMCTQSDLSYVEMLKKLCGKEEWIRYRDKILESKTAWSIKYQLMEREELYERLLKEVINSGYVYTLDQYEKVLKKRFPKEVRDAYIAYVQRKAEWVSDRKHYKELVQYLKKIKKYPDGEKYARKVAEEWKSLYRRRPAMMDELQKAGF